MGTTTLRYWDSRAYDSRPARAGDPPSEVFEAYIPHPISGWTPDLNAGTWHRVAAATQRCRDLQHGAAGRLPAEWLLDRAESIASSSIEGIRPSARRVARAEARLALFGEQPADDEMQALRNIGVTAHARDLAASGAALSVDGLRQLHETLMGEDPIAGQVRDRQNWIGAGLLAGPLQAHHVGPPPEAVPGLLEDLVAYINRPDDGIAMVRAAVAHAQFETIHPFPDGNGRTGRALLQYMYLRAGLAAAAALPISAALMLTRREYFEALDETRVVCSPEDPSRSRALRSWIEHLAAASEHACRLHDRLNAHVDALQRLWADTARRHRIRPSSAAFRLLAHLVTNPVVTANSAQRLLGSTERTARNAVSRLAQAGIVAQRSAGRRNRVFECVTMMDAFTEASRHEPADNLTLLPAAGPHPAASPTATGRSQTTADDDDRLCNAATTRGHRCTHPKPRPGGNCPAGHPHPN